MIGLGTIINVVAIVVGGLFGLIFKRFIKERFQETVIKVQGFAVIVMAIGSTMSQMLKVSVEQTGTSYVTGISTQGTMVMIVSLALGGLLGELINLDAKFEKFGTWLRNKTGNQKDGSFIDAFVTASMTVCIGAMAIIGSIQDGISGDYNTLLAKSILDLVIIVMLTASMGKGAMFSAIPVGLLQGSVTLLARFIEPIMTPTALSNLSLVGNVLILCVGVNLVWPKTIRVANLLPAIILAVGFAFIPLPF